ncbi:MAG: leucine-rich repeat domain-containing protein [Candidatus Electrothrix aestuarii]|uniref:non-specific serine/threonine protein kinase n=1 Tax=Candidatus Electrothrix aestuarii TaxID=3062594 RepID=A0AAU8LQS3_9BACT|nr:leucine-rich repeat domain-containing protein [Candidatus Electrothrix aestuarii]
MASNDLEVIEEIEKALRVRLHRVDQLEPDLLSDRFCYIADEQEHITALNLNGADLINANINFSLFNELNQLRALVLNDNQISDCSFLKELDQLQTLGLGSNQLSDISFLKELGQLQTLSLGSNQISDYSFLKELDQLQRLELSDNQINDYSFLKELGQLQTLILSDNQISDCSFLKELDQLQVLNLIGNQISDCSFLKELGQLQVLNLSWNQINDISSLKELTRLQELDLSDNQINDISSLKGLVRLQTLDLRNNQISDYSFLKKLTRLQTLSLSWNQISDISFLKELVQLQTLELTSNQISEISSFQELGRTQRISLTWNQVSDTSLLKRLHQMQQLDLSDNKYSDLFKELSQMQTLLLRNNQGSDVSFLNIKELNQLQAQAFYLNNNQSSNLFNILSQLQTLSSSNNQLVNTLKEQGFKELNQWLTLPLKNNQLSDVLKELNQLQALYLSNNQISDCSFLKELVRLKTLSLSWNQISDISTLKGLSQLQSLDLNNNQISDISALKELNQLQTLSLRNNQISDCSFLKELNQLQSLDLSNNQISDISGLNELNQLRKINLAENQIADLAVLQDFIFLAELNCWKNQLTSLPQWITELRPEIVYADSRYEFEKINVGGNPLTCPPPEIITYGRKAVQAYFKSLENGSVRLHEAKVLLVGKSMAGKTSLLKHLQGLSFNEHESQTHGINVLPLAGKEIPGFEHTDADCRLHFWDFGGQEIMHASHRFFMSSRSVYILVLDCRDDTSRNHWSWLQHIEKYGGRSPLIVVMNKIDLNPSYNIEQKSINERFPWIKNRFFRISCKSGEGLPELVRSMAASVPNTPLYGIEISKTWMEIRKRLEKATDEQNYINQEQFIAICKEHGVEDEESRIFLLKLFNDLGTVLYFEDLDLVDIYVLDPHWVTVGVYKIINSTRTKDGILHDKDLDFILNKEHIRSTEEYDPFKQKCFIYNPRERSCLVQIMEEFELCYPYNKHQHILPNQLPKEPEQEPELQGENLLRFVMKYDFLPSSLFSRLMVRLKDDIQDRLRQWRYGMFLEDKDLKVQAIIRMEEQNNRIMISITGGLHSKRQYLSIIRHAIEGLGFQELEPEELVPLPGHSGAFAKYKDLLGHEQKGWATYRDGTLGEEFSVSDLLDSVVSKDERNKDKERIVVEHHNHVKIENVGNPQINQNVTQNNTQTVNQSVDLLNQLKDAQALFRNLKDDILDEAEIEIEDEKEKKRVARELDKAEKAMTAAEKAVQEGKEPDAATKSRLEEFFNSLADKSSRLGKALKFVDQGTQKVQKLARTYNSIAGNIGLPTVPPLLLGKESKEKE